MSHYFIVGVDQDGDAIWDVCKTLEEVKARKEEMDETCYQSTDVFLVDPSTTPMGVTRVDIKTHVGP